MEDIIEFLSNVGKLKEIPRTGWVESGVEEPESVADHSFRTAVLAMLLADLQGLDSGKAAKMALLHDLAEASTGDLTPEDKRQRGPAYLTEEEEAMGGLLSKLPRDVAARYKALWDEFRRGSSPEARVVAQADKVEMLLQASEYEGGGVDPSRLERFWHSMVGEGLASELLREIRKKRKKDVA
ncbi:HD domain-containing protein [Candidatus Bathyarchaeota archaeon]|nr:MAG: HD domain-containing protein [Candidatus Bathyarchaeota archaeon]